MKLKKNLRIGVQHALSPRIKTSLAFQDERTTEERRKNDGKAQHILGSLYGDWIRHMKSRFKSVPKKKKTPKDHE